MTTAYFFDHLATEADTAVTVTEADFRAAKRELVGSVSAKELEHYARVRATFEGAEQKIGKPRISSQLLLPGPTRGPMPTRSKDKRSIVGGAKASDAPVQESKGKGKSRHDDSSDEDDDDAYITSNDFQATPERGSRSRSTTGFGTGDLREEEAMYE